MDVFISYARADGALVARLQQELLAAGKQAWVDLEGILVAEEWWPRITAAITAADNFVLILSPYSARSVVCLKEVRFAVSTNKRVIPIQVSKLTEMPADEIARINWLKFPEAPEAFSSGVRDLIKALDTDPHWVHEHTRLLVRATAWRDDPDSSRLLDGVELTNAEEWLSSSREGRVPVPTATHFGFIEASRAFVDEEKLRTVRARAILEARRIAPLAAARMSRNEPSTAYRLAALSWEADANEVAQKVLFDFSNCPLEVELHRGKPLKSIDLDPAGRRVLIGGEGGASVLDLFTLEERLLFGGEDVMMLRYSPDGSMIATVSGYMTQPKLTLWRGSERLWDYKLEEVFSTVSFSKDGCLVFMSSWDGAVRVFDANGGVQSLLRHPDFVYDARPSSDGRRLITASRDGIARIWETSGKLVRALGDATGGAVAYLGSEDAVLTSHSKGAAIWTANGQCLHVLVSSHPAKFVTSSSDGLFVATGQDVDEVLLWERAQPHRDDVSILGLTFRRQPREDWVLKAKLHAPGWISTVAFSPDSRFVLAAAGPNKLDADFKRRRGWSTVRLWDLAGRLVSELKHPNMIECARFSPRGNFVMTASEDGTARLGRVSYGPVASIDHDNRINDADFLAARGAVVTGSAEGIVKVWDLSGHLLSSFATGAHVTTVSAHPSDSQILVAGHDGEARLFESSGELRATFRPSVRAFIGDAAVEARFSADGRFVITTAYNTTTIWMPSGERVVDLVHKKGGAITSARLSPDGRFALTAGLDKTGAKLWNIDGRLLAEFPDEDYYVTVAEFWPIDGLILTSGKSPKLWSSSGKLLRTFDIPSARQVIVLARAMVVVEDQNTTASLWSLQGRLVASLEHDDYVTWAAASGDQMRVLTVTKRCLSVWDLAGNLLTTIDPGSEIDMAQLMFNDSYCLIRSDSSATLWDRISPNRIIEYYERRVPPLSAQDRRAFFGADDDAGPV